MSTSPTTAAMSSATIAGRTASSNLAFMLSLLPSALRTYGRSSRRKISCGVLPGFVHAGHVGAEHFCVRVAARKGDRELAAVHHGDAIGEGEDLGEVGRDEEDGLAGVASF